MINKYLVNDGNFDLSLRSFRILGLSHTRSAFIDCRGRVHLYQNQSTQMNASIIHNKKKYLEGDVLPNSLYGQVIVSHQFIVNYVSFNYIKSCSNKGGSVSIVTGHVTPSVLDPLIFTVDTLVYNNSMLFYC